MRSNLNFRPTEKQLNRNALRSNCELSYGNLINMNLLYRINKSRELRLCANVDRGHYCIRICVSYEFATETCIKRAWEVIKSFYVDSLDEEWLDASSIPSDARRRSTHSFVNILDSTSRREEGSSSNLLFAFGPVPLSSLELSSSSSD